MRVALNLEQLLQHPPGGIGRYSAELARLLPTGNAADEPIDLVPFVARHPAVDIARAASSFGVGNLDIVRLRLPRPVLYDAWNLLGTPALGSLSRSLRDLDLVHAPSVAVPPRSSAALVVTVHDAATELFPRTFPRRGRVFHRRGLRAASRRADLVITPTHAAAEEIAEHSELDRERIRVVHHGVLQDVAGAGVIDVARSTAGLAGDPYVLWVGSLEPRKNLPVLLEAFRSVVAAGLPHRLAIVGPDGWLDTGAATRGPAAELGDRVRFLGSVRADRLVALYGGASLLAFPSLHEGFGLPVMEAMAQETAVVCSDIPVLREIAGDAARFLPATDADAWGEALVETLRDETGLARLASAGRVRAGEFTPARFVERTLAVYREAIRAHASA